VTKKERKEYMRKYNKEYRQENKEAVSKQKKEWYQEHRDAVKKRLRGYYQKNKEKFKKYRQDNREARKEHSREYHRKIRLETPWAFHLQYAKQRCNDPNTCNYKWYGGKGVKLNLTMDEMKKLYLRDNAGDMKRPTIDRIDSNSNYTFGNCRFLELSENIKRSKKGN